MKHHPAPVSRVTVLSGGVGGARFTRGLLAYLESAGHRTDVTVIVNTGDDMWLHGVRVCPDLDTMMYTLGEGVEESQGWGRAGETATVATELRRYQLGWDWFTLGDRDLATHLARTELLRAGWPLSRVTARLCERCDIAPTILPMTDHEVETMVVMAGDGPADLRTVHFEEWWVRLRAAVPAERFVQTGVAHSVAAPGVLESIQSADVVLLPPSNPVVSIGTILGIPGIASALAATAAPVVGISPIIGGSAVRGMADACLQAIGVETSAEAVAHHYRAAFGILDGWLVDSIDHEAAGRVTARGLLTKAVPLWMSDLTTTQAMAQESLLLAEELRH